VFSFLPFADSIQTIHEYQLELHREVIVHDRRNVNKFTRSDENNDLLLKMNVFPEDGGFIFVDFNDFIIHIDTDKIQFSWVFQHPQAL
jgi:hypothetical protein